jgi:hypothetical protein
LSLTSSDSTLHYFQQRTEEDLLYCAIALGVVYEVAKHILDDLNNGDSASIRNNLVALFSLVEKGLYHEVENTLKRLLSSCWLIQGVNEFSFEYPGKVAEHGSVESHSSVSLSILFVGNDTSVSEGAYDDSNHLSIVAVLLYHVVAVGHS